MITIEDEDFVRICLLLLKGGGMVSEGILNREVHKSGKSLDESLENFEITLKEQFFRVKQKNVLYPASGQTKIKDWDLQILTGVLLTVFNASLAGNEKEAIEKIKSFRNEIYAHRSLEPLTHSEYEVFRKQLVDALEVLSSNLDRAEQQKFKELLKECTETRLDAPTVNTLLEGISGTKELAKEILNRINQISQELGQKIDEQHEKTRTENVENSNFVVDELGQKLDEQHEKTLTVLREAILLISRPNESSKESGFEDVASSKALSSTRQSVASEEEKEEGKEISIGMSFGNDQIRSSVGPFVSVEGIHSKCFVTSGHSPVRDIAYEINNRRWNVKVLADIRSTLLVAVNDAGSSGGKGVNPGSELLMQANRAHLTAGTKVFKVGLSGYTEGVISNLREEHILVRGKSETYVFNDILLVKSLVESPFAQQGDSGSAVFCQIEDKVCCIGVVIGGYFPHKTVRGYRHDEVVIIVDRIENVLTDLKNVYGKQISLDMYEMNLQLSKYPHLKDYIEKV